jgi:hypothetical protein
MFKKIFSAAKNLLKSPVGQIGIGLLLPGMAPSFAAMSKLGGIKGALGGIGAFAAQNPMLTQAAAGLLGGAKPADVLRNVAYGTAARGIGSMMQPGGTFMGGVQQSLGMSPRQAIPTGAQPMGGGSFNVSGGDTSGFSLGNQEQLIKGATTGGRSFLQQVGLERVGEDLSFFDRYSPLLSLGQLGLTVAAAALGEDQAKLLYDPTKNPYLASGREDQQDFYANINPYYSAATEAQGMNKGGVMDFPEKDGMINGPGDGQSDDIPAMLSDGEFVMTKQAVMAAGNGNRDEGTKKMYDMMYSLEDKARNMGIGRV